MFEVYTAGYLKDRLVSREAFHPFPTVENRAFWMGLPGEVKTRLEQNAELFREYQITPLTASLFMDYFQTGRRKSYEDPFFLRRTALGSLVMAECLFDDGRYLAQIVDLVWAICEESTWAAPSHNYVFPGNAGVEVGCLPDVEQDIFDLFAGETGGLLSFVYYLLGPRLHGVSPLLTKRMNHELCRRITAPYLSHDGYHWMLFHRQEGVLVNNWTPWCTSNAVISLLLMEEDRQKRADGIAKALRSLDLFVETYAEEGGCDEGPGYWYQAAGCLFDALYMIQQASSGTIDFFEGNAKLKHMAHYIVDMHIYGDHFVSYADGEERCGFLPQKLYAFGACAGDASLQNLALTLFADQGNRLPPQGNLFKYLLGVTLYHDMDGKTPDEPDEEDVWLRDLGIACFRETGGFYLSCKGGHNGESHNHNDVGNFIVYYRDAPVLVDMGVGNYTRQHWGPTRYEVFSERTAYHNLPMVNGSEEAEGEQYRARSMSCSAEGCCSRAEIEFGGAYPAGSGIVSWNREYILCRGDGVYVQESAQFDRPSRIEFHFITPHQPKETADGILFGEVLLCSSLSYSGIVCEMLDLDSKLSHSWENGLWRLTVTFDGEYRRFETTWSLRPAHIEGKE